MASRQTTMVGRPFIWVASPYRMINIRCYFNHATKGTRIMANNSKKPGPAPRPTPAKASSAPQPELDEDDLNDEGDEADDDEEDGGPSVNGNGKPISNGRRKWMATQKLAPSKREAVLMGNLVNKLMRREDIIKDWSVPGGIAAKASISEALDHLKAAAQALAGIDPAWRPVTARTSSSNAAPLEAGAVVKITDKRRNEYAGVIPDEAMVGIKVKELRGNRVVVVMNDGVQAMFPRGHVCLDV